MDDNDPYDDTIPVRVPMDDNDPYDDTIPVRVVVTPTLLIPVYQVKRKKRKKEWVQRIALVGIIVTWILLATTTAFLFYMILISGRMIP